jgi:hypothetical protein
MLGTLARILIGATLGVLFLVVMAVALTADMADRRAQS